MVKHCCEDMRNNLYCIEEDILSNDIFDATVHFSSKFREYGIPVNDNGYISSSYIIINYCPWCGRKLPASKRQEWFRKLEEMGFDSPLSQDIPALFRSSDWYDSDS